MPPAILSVEEIHPGVKFQINHAGMDKVLARMFFEGRLVFLCYCKPAHVDMHRAHALDSYKYVVEAGADMP